MALPEGLKFLAFGWWVVHIASVVLVFMYGYRRGRDDARKAAATEPEKKTAAS
jgi:K+ transporter